MKEFRKDLNALLKAQADYTLGEADLRCGRWNAYEVVERDRERLAELKAAFIDRWGDAPPPA